MSVLNERDVWVGAERRADGDPRRRDWYPRGYVTLEPKDSARVHLTPHAARTVAKRLKEFADVLDPPTPRKRRTT